MGSVGGRKGAKARAERHREVLALLAKAEAELRTARAEVEGLKWKFSKLSQELRDARLADGPRSARSVPCAR